MLFETRLWPFAEISLRGKGDPERELGGVMSKHRDHLILSRCLSKVPLMGRIRQCRPAKMAKVESSATTIKPRRRCVRKNAKSSTPRRLDDG